MRALSLSMLATRTAPTASPSRIGAARMAAAGPASSSDASAVTPRQWNCAGLSSSGLQHGVAKLMAEPATERAGSRQRPPGAPAATLPLATSVLLFTLSATLHAARPLSH